MALMMAAEKGERREMTDVRVDLTVEVGPTRLKNPVIAASGTFGFGEEMASLLPLSELGGIATKGFTLEPRAGNAPPRVAECAAGMLNSVGLQNPGLEHVLTYELPYMAAQDALIIANIAGRSIEDYATLCERLAESPAAVIELNLSCPNVKDGCMAFGTDPRLIEAVTVACRRVSRQPLWVKLTPNVTDIAEMARAAEAGGATAVSLINTLLGMAVDLRTRRPILRNNIGGYSGPGVKPIALRMVHEICQTVKIPVVGMGGIADVEDALEFILAGAAAVQIGAATLRSPLCLREIIHNMPGALAAAGFDTLAELRGALRLWP